MAGGIIINRAQAYSIVPVQVIENHELSDKAVRVYAWVRSHAPGWEIQIWDLRKRLKIGDKAWKSVRLQLTKAGLIRLVEQERLPEGRWGPATLEIFDPLQKNFNGE